MEPAEFNKQLIETNKHADYGCYYFSLTNKIWTAMEGLHFGQPWRGYTLDSHGGVTLWTDMEWLHFGQPWRGYTLDSHGGITLWTAMEGLHYGQPWRGYTLDSRVIKSYGHIVT